MGSNFEATDVAAVASFDPTKIKVNWKRAALQPHAALAFSWR